MRVHVIIVVDICWLCVVVFVVLFVIGESSLKKSLGFEDDSSKHQACAKQHSCVYAKVNSLEYTSSNT